MYNLVAHLNLLHHYKPKVKRIEKGKGMIYKNYEAFIVKNKTNNLNVLEQLNFIIETTWKPDRHDGIWISAPPPTMFFGQFISGVRTSADSLAALNLCPPVLAQL